MFDLHAKYTQAYLTYRCTYPVKTAHKTIWRLFAKSELHISTHTNKQTNTQKHKHRPGCLVINLQLCVYTGHVLTFQTKECTLKKLKRQCTIIRKYQVRCSCVEMYSSGLTNRQQTLLFCVCVCVYCWSNLWQLVNRVLL